MQAETVWPTLLFPVEIWERILWQIPLSWDPRRCENPDPFNALYAHRSTTDVAAASRTVKERARLLRVCKAWYPIVEEILYSDLLVTKFQDLSNLKTRLAMKRQHGLQLGHFTQTMLVCFREINPKDVEKEQEQEGSGEQHDDIEIGGDDDESHWVDEDDWAFQLLKAIAKLCPKLIALHINNTARHRSKHRFLYTRWFTALPTTLTTLTWRDTDGLPWPAINCLTAIAPHLINLQFDVEGNDVSRVDNAGPVFDFPVLRQLVLRQSAVLNFNLNNWITPSLEQLSVFCLCYHVDSLIDRSGKSMKALEIGYPNCCEAPGVFQPCPELQTLIFPVSFVECSKTANPILAADLVSTHPLSKLILQYRRSYGDGSKLKAIGKTFSSPRFPNLDQVTLARYVGVCNRPTRHAKHCPPDHQSLFAIKEIHPSGLFKAGVADR